MRSEICEEVLMNLMAVFDGEDAEIAPEQLNAHLSSCDDCRAEIERMQNTFNLLKQQESFEPAANLWAAVEPRIEVEAKTNWKPFAFLAVFLVLYKLLEMLPATSFGLMFKIVPLVFVALLFTLLKENPFKINTELVLEK
jgi:predicted anti-sigma-YlaC factor YlaD